MYLIISTLLACIGRSPTTEVGAHAAQAPDVFERDAMNGNMHASGLDCTEDRPCFVRFTADNKSGVRRMYVYEYANEEGHAVREVVYTSDGELGGWSYSPWGQVDPYMADRITFGLQANCGASRPKLPLPDSYRDKNPPPCGIYPTEDGGLAIVYVDLLREQVKSDWTPI